MQVGLFDGKVALVTGAGRGIGREEALLLAAEGASVVVNDADAGPAQQVVDEIVTGGGAGQSNYAAAKAGIASLTLVMARELERLGVRVNAIAPVARTRLTEAVAGDHMKPDGFDRFDPANVAAVACWLASDDAAGITGQVVKVQGGQLQLLDSVGKLRRAILGPTDGRMPAFFFASPPPGREPYPAAP